MSKKVNKLIPELRFPEFEDEGEWAEKKIDDVCDVNPSNTELPDEFVYIDLESVESGRLLKRNIIKLKNAPSRAQRLLENGDIIYQMVRPYQKNNLFFDINDKLDYVASTGYALLRAYQSKMYLYQYVHSENFVNRVLAKCTGSNYPAINSSDLSEIRIEIPKPKEQQKIASCLSSLDEVIAAHSQKLELLKEHKKGLMQNLFPQEGEKVPKSRFKEFAKDGEWVEKTLDYYIDLFSGIPLRSEEITDDESGIPILRGINITEGYIRHTKDIDKFFLGEIENLNRYLVKENDIVIGMDGSKVGKNVALIGKEDENSILIQRVARIRTNKNADVHFVYQHFISDKFRGYVDKVNTSSGIPHISAQQIRDFKVGIPPKVKEQQKIASCLSSLDKLITAQTEKLEQLNLHQKGLMQGMFPKMND